MIEHNSRELFDALSNAEGARKEPLEFVVTATHTYRAFGGRIFFVPKEPYRNNYCTGTRAIVIDGVAGERVACPVCHTVCAVSPSLTVWAHYKRDKGGES